MTRLRSVASRRATLHLVAFLVALCSFAYELVYSELLTVVYGGTVVQYGLTIGLFFSSLGVGSFLARHFDDARSSNFLRTELYLAIAAPVGFLFVVWLGALDLPAAVPALVERVAVRLPVVAVGVLSGFELPLLLAMARDEAPGGERSGWLRSVAEATSAASFRLLSVPFHTSRESDAYDTDSAVLAADYVGGLAGALLWVFVLYPRLGLIPSVAVLALLNCVAALVFAVRFGADDWFRPGAEARDRSGIGSKMQSDGGSTTRPDGRSTNRPDSRSTNRPDSRSTNRPDGRSTNRPDAKPHDCSEAESGGRSGDGSDDRSDDEFTIAGDRGVRIAVAACLLLGAIYGGAALHHDRLESELTEYYFEGVVEQEYPRGTVDVSVLDQRTTRHQRVVTYDRTWTGETENHLFAGESETCMRLDHAVQLCESWADSYHRGLVDVPMSSFENGTETNVLLAGGGDWIAADRLRAHGVSVDQVDLDGEFMAAAKDDPLLERYHDDAYEYRHLESHRADVFQYLQSTDEQYDLILLDLPGARNSELLHLYSVEFYSLLRSHLTEGGVVATWTYSPYAYGTHAKVYRNTVRAAGFDQYLPYSAYDDLDADGELEHGEGFALLAPEDGRPTIDPENGSEYVRRHEERYGSLEWRPVPSYEGVETNRVFDPNYDVLVGREVNLP